MSKKKKKADIEQVMATFSALVKERYPEPDQFNANLRNLLDSKKQRMARDEYILSLEKNSVFLKDLVSEGEAYLELVLGRINDETLTSGEIGKMLGELESKVRSSTAERRDEIIAKGEKGEFGEIIALKESDPEVYLEKLEFNYMYMMSMRLFLFEFFGLLIAAREEYVIERADDAALRYIMNNIEMTANFYLENISVGEIVEEDKPAGKANP
jgi:hypothetical protein